MRDFLKRKGVSLSAKIYFIDALSNMALGLFASLIIGLIIKTVGEQFDIKYFNFLVEMGKLAMSLMGPVIWTMESNAEGAGMGTSGLVGQIMTFTTMGFGPDIFMKVVLLHFIGPAVISLLLSEYMRKKAGLSLAI